MNIVDTIYTYLPAKRRQTPKGWIKFNAVCCHHNNTTADTRSRGGIIRNGEGVSYHCFNCGFKASYVAGRPLSHKMKSLLSWFGMPDDVISKLSLEALKSESEQSVAETAGLQAIEYKPMPDGSRLLVDAALENNDALACAEYILSRGFTFDDCKWMWSPTMPDRVLIPFTYEHKPAGWTGRKIVDGKPRYLSDQTPGYVFNLDAQPYERPYLIVVEGPLDAISIEGVAVLGAEIMDNQVALINRLHTHVMLVPDCDKDGARSVERAIELGWAVSMPKWGNGVKDVNQAICKYGKLYTLYMIMAAKEESPLKIRLAAKQWFRGT